MDVGEQPLEEKKFEKVKLCPDCGNEDIGFESGENFCKKCGLVLD